MSQVLNYFRIAVACLLIMSASYATAQRLKLFSSEQRENACPSHVIVMDFLERYFNELPQVKHTTISTKMADDKVCFKKGMQSDLFQISDTMPFSINLAYRFYKVEWKKQEKPFVTIVFPAQYDLLLGMQQEEAQNKLKETILAAPRCNNIIEIPKKPVLIDDGIFMSKNSYLELESFTDATYYNKVGGSFKPYFDAAHLDYSAADLFHGLIADADYQMYVEQSVYGLKSVNYTISLRQWLDYCAAWGMNVYFSVEEQREDGLLALVVVQNVELGFNHMLSVVIPDKLIRDRKTILKARMTAYIPTHNVKSLFQKEIVNRRKIKWQ